jgi:hypothetical protein
MTITLTFGTWMIPFGITILSHIIALVVARLFKDDLWGMLSFSAIIIALGASISSCITWGLMLLLK